MKTTTIGSMAGIELINILKTLDGAISYDGECSTQVAFRLKNGRTVRFGVTDEDVTPIESQGLWVDQYAGLAVEEGDPLSWPSDGDGQSSV